MKIFIFSFMAVMTFFVVPLLLKILWEIRKNER